MFEIKMHWMALTANNTDKSKSLKILNSFERKQKKGNKG